MVTAEVVQQYCEEVNVAVLDLPDFDKRIV